MQEGTIYSRFKEIVKAQPDSIAIETDETAVTYRQLDGLVNNIMAKFYLDKHSFIGVVMQHGIEQIASMLAILKSGAAYVPAEPVLPQKRIDYMMETSGVRHVITDESFGDLKSVHEDLPDLSQPGFPAYVLYTSGTTGRPKGVIIENHSVVNYARAFENEFHTGKGDVMLQYSVCSFDIFVEEVFTTLLNGATLYIPSWNIHDKPIEELLEAARKHKVTILDGFPYLLADINNHGGELPETVNLIISGGDVIREAYISRLKNRGVRIYNTYGPSETTVCSNYYRIDNVDALPDGTYPIGKSISGVSTKVLDENLNEVAAGEVGEICIFGEGVSRGYTGNPPEQKNFVTLTDGQRMYRSGDLGYILPDGNLAFMHRKDDQVMIYGKRVEPSEVENVLNSMPGIESAVVKALKDDEGLHYLVAYYVAEESISIEDVKSYLESCLSDFMVPSNFVRLERIPLTPRGKVDTKALPVVLRA